MKAKELRQGDVIQGPGGYAILTKPVQNLGTVTAKVQFTGDGGIEYRTWDADVILRAGIVRSES